MSSFTSICLTKMKNAKESVRYCSDRPVENIENLDIFNKEGD